MNQQILKLKSDGRFKGIQLTADELWLLEYLQEVRVLSTQNIHQFYGITSGGRRVGNTVTNRLGRLVDAGILYRLNDAVSKRVIFRPVNYAYRLGKRGMELLASRGILTVDELETTKHYSNQINMPTLHNNAVNTIFMDFFEEFHKHDQSMESLNVKSYRGDRHPLIIDIGKGNNIRPIIPDWIYETEQHIICVEVDSGAQNLNIIKNKYDRYNLLAREIKKPIVVLFSVGIFEEGENEARTKERRIASVKDTFPESAEWEEGIDIIVTPTNRTAHILFGLLKRQSYRGPLHSRGAANDWLLKSNKVGQAGLSVHVSRNQELYQLLTKSEVDLDLVVEIKKGDLEKFGGLLFMEEGSVRSYQRARANMKRINSWNNNRNMSETKASLIMIYADVASALNDIVALMPMCNTLVVSNEALDDAINSGERVFPKVLMMLTQFTRKERNII